MDAVVDRFSDAILKIGSADALRRLAENGAKPNARPRVNAHVHLPPNFSAFETVTQAVELASAQSVGVLGASNYYDYAVYADFAAEAARQGVFPLFGLEIIARIENLVAEGIRINDPGNPGKMYLCGKGITRFAPMTAEAAGLLQTIRDQDGERMELVTSKLAAIFADAGLETGLDADAIKDRVAQRHGCRRETVHLQERHLAQAFQEALFAAVPEPGRTDLLAKALGAASQVRPDDAVGVQNEIRSHLMKAGKAAFAPDTFVGFDHAYRLILALGGIPCYPTLADGVAPITQYEADEARLIADLKARGIVCAELIPNRNTPEVLGQYVHAIRDAGLFVTAGTEHNTLELLPLAPTCLHGVPIPEDVQAIFWEGACVVAAHQVLMMQGQPGFVDAEGRLNPDYPSDDARIRAFAELGAAVIAQYKEVCA